jgi:hypothetical protein
MNIFWVVVACSLVEVYWQHGNDLGPDEWGTKYFRNASKLVPNYMRKHASFIKYKNMITVVH